MESVCGYYCLNIVVSIKDKLSDSDDLTIFKCFRVIFSLKKKNI